MTGCAGFIGSHLAEALLARGDEVVGVDSLSESYDRQAKLANLDRPTGFGSFTLVQADLADGDVGRLLEDVEVVYHLAAEPGVRAGWGPRYALYLRNNLLATQRLLEAARGREGLRVVFASSSSVYGTGPSGAVDESSPTAPLSPYGQTKLGAEQLCGIYRDGHGVDSRVLRYFTVFGPRQRPDMAFTRFLSAALDGHPVTVIGDGHQTRDFTYVADAVAATLAAADLDPGDADLPFNVGGGAPASVTQALELIAALTGGALDVRHLPAEPGEPRHTAANTSRARDLLGFRPATSLADGLASQLAWLERMRAQATASLPVPG